MTRSERNPDSKKAAGTGRTPQLYIVLFLIAFTYLVRLPYLDMPLERDEGEYAYIGWRMAEGEIPYRDVFDQKAPGTFAVYRLTFALLGRSPRDIHLAGGAFVAVEVVLLYLLASVWVRRPIAIGAAMLCAWLTAGITLMGFSSNTETFGAPFIVLAVLLSVRARRRDCWWEFLLAGLSVGVGSLMKQPVLFFGLVPAALSLWCPDAPNGKRFSILRPISVGAGVLLAWLPVFITFVVRGALADMVYCVFLHNLQYADVSWVDTVRRVTLRARNFALSYSFLVVLVLVGLVDRIRRRADTVLLFVAWIVASVLAVGIGHLYRHYFLLAVPVGVVLAAIGFQYLWDKLKGLGAWATVSRVGLVLLTVGFPVVDNVPDAVETIQHVEMAACKLYGNHIFSASPLVASWVAQLTKPDETLYVFGTEPQIPFYAQRRLCTKHILTDPIFGPYDRAEEFQNQVKQDILRHKPPVVVEVRAPTSVLLRSMEAPLFKFLMPHLDDSYVQVAGALILSLDGPRFVTGRRQLAEHINSVRAQADEAVRRGLPEAQIHAFIKMETTMMVVHFRRDLLDRLPPGW